jgi:hypothetical protein
MNDQFPPPGWFMRPETWPYWMPSSLTGARMPAEPPRDVWPSHWAGKAHGGILGNLARPPDELWPNTRAATAVPLAMPPAVWVTLLPEFDWSENSAAAPYQFPVRDAFAGIGGETIRKPPTEPGLEPTGVTAPTSPVGRPLNPVPHFTVRAMFCCLPPSRNRHRRRRIFGRGCVRPCPTKTCATTPAHTCTRRC